MKILLISAMPQGNFPYLQQANEEIDGIDEILRPNLSKEDFDVERRQHIVRSKLVKLLEFEPDIVHFTGHGESEGLVFEDGIPIPKEQLTQLFQNQKIQLLFLNICINIILYL
jgi:hypothetical protein